MRLDLGLQKVSHSFGSKLKPGFLTDLTLSVALSPHLNLINENAFVTDPHCLLDNVMFGVQAFFEKKMKISCPRLLPR